MSYHDLDFAIDLTVDNAHTRVLRLVGSDKDVLELGCSSGYMSRVLAEQFNCRVTGVERNPEAAERARAVCVDVVEADLDGLDVAQRLKGRRFDVIVCADVLEHLRDPVAALGALRPLLTSDGYVVASIPNIAHVSILVELIQGRFDYRSEGLLDETHLRFFTLNSVHDCFERAGLEIDHLDRLRLEPEQTEYRSDLSAWDSDLVALLRSHPESTTYQFILSARPGQAGDARPASSIRAGLYDALPPHGQRGATELLAAIDALMSRVQFLEDRREGLTREIGKLREDVLHRDVRIHELERTLEAKARADETGVAHGSAERGSLPWLERLARALSRRAR